MIAERQRCNDSAFLDSRLNLDSEEVFGFKFNVQFFKMLISGPGEKCAGAIAVRIAQYDPDA